MTSDGRKNHLAGLTCCECDEPMIFGVPEGEPVAHPMCPVCERAVSARSADGLRDARLRLLGILEPGSGVSDPPARDAVRAALRDLESVISALDADF